MSEQSTPKGAELTGVEQPSKRGRKPGFRMSEEHRDKIRNSNILSALIAHVTDGREMTATQVTAGLGLLNKVLPNLSSVALSGDDEADPIRQVTTIELVAPVLNDKATD